MTSLRIRAYIIFSIAENKLIACRLIQQLPVKDHASFHYGCLKASAYSLSCEIPQILVGRRGNDPRSYG